MSTLKVYAALSLALSLVLAPVPLALAQTISAPVAAQSLDSIREIAVATIASSLPPGAQAEAAPLDSRVRMPACARPLQAVPASSGGVGGHTVVVSCSAPQTWSLYVPVRVSNVRNVVFATRNLPAGATIPADALAVRAVDAARLPNGYIENPANVAGQVAQRPLIADAAVSPLAVAPPPSVHRGETVEILGRAGAMEVRAAGKALADAGTGQRVQVENLSSRRIVEGTVREDGRVEVRI